MRTDPYYRRSRPSPQNPFSFAADRVDLTSVHLPPYPTRDASGALPDLRPLANSLFDGRAAAGVRCAVGRLGSVILDPVGPDVVLYNPKDPAINIQDGNALLESRPYPGSAPMYFPTSKCLAAMAFADYFRGATVSLRELAISSGFVKGPVSFKEIARALGVQTRLSLRDLLPAYINLLRAMVSDAIRKATPGWCGTFGPLITGAPSLSFYEDEGNYDMVQMFLIPLAYAYYGDLASDAQGKLVDVLLQKGRIHRPNMDEINTSGQVPHDWALAGFVSPLNVRVDIMETENHVLMIAAARYLGNQLLYQRSKDWRHDNRRNRNGVGKPSCFLQLLGLLRNYLRNDFAEYNAKNY